ncbi:MAG: hypothetical protein Q4A90_02320 [Streptococcus sp.]|nr:hypothetical protein [Streptococcus sp.]
MKNHYLIGLAYLLIGITFIILGNEQSHFTFTVMGFSFVTLGLFWMFFKNTGKGK